MQKSKPGLELFYALNEQKLKPEEFFEKMKQFTEEQKRKKTAQQSLTLEAQQRTIVSH